MSIYQKKIITSGGGWAGWGPMFGTKSQKKTFFLDTFPYRYHIQVPTRLIPQQWRWKTPNSVFQICLGCHRTAPGEKIRVCQIWLLVWPFIWLLIWILLSTCIWVLQTQGLTFPLNYGHLTAAPNTVHGEVNRYMDIWQSPHRKQQLRIYIFFTRWFIGLSEPCSTGPVSSHFGETPTRPFTFGSWMKCFPIFDAFEPTVRTAIAHVNSTSTKLFADIAKQELGVVPWDGSPHIPPCPILPPPFKKDLATICKSRPNVSPPPTAICNRPTPNMPSQPL